MNIIQKIYGNLVGLHKIRGFYQLLKFDCKTGKIVEYASGLEKNIALKVIETEKLDRIPYRVMREESEMLQKYLSKN